MMQGMSSIQNVQAGMSSMQDVQSGRLPLKESGRTVFVPLEQVEYLEAYGNYVCVHAGAQRFLVREKLSAFCERLQPHDFIRIHRSVIVNRRRIQELRRRLTGKYVVTLVSGKELTLSRGYRSQLHVLRKPF
jgi:two-component system LytT family response regulator